MIFCWEDSAGDLIPERLWWLLNTLEVGNHVLHEREIVSVYEFEAVGMFIQSGGKYYPSSYGEPQNEFEFYAPIKVNEKIIYIDSKENSHLKKRGMTPKGTLLDWSEYMDKMAQMLNVVRGFLPPFIMIQPGATITIYPRDGKVDVQVMGEFLPNTKFIEYKPYAGWMKNCRGDTICEYCGTEGDLLTMCDCWLQIDDWSMGSY
eukprot:Seg2027.7 transcript_id=Seg2027.7/GoldUCD/mRNA.D3Y31 product="hypothetical protein" protein_id=Seg2027.7/GoldUCD/D3Y31